jgi:hypothetical protein
MTLALPQWAGAVTTRSFRVTSYSDFDAGEAKGVLISSLGELTPGYATHRADLPDVAFVRCAVEAQDGTVYLGTGDQGELWSYERGKLRKVAKLPDAVEITSLAVAADGSILVGSTPGGRIYSVRRGGVVRELAKLDVDHVWALELDAGKRTLYVGTGSQGKLFAVDTQSGSSRLVWDSGQKHLRSLLRADDGALWVGTGDEAILYRVTPGGEARAVHDFDGEEIRALAHQGTTLYAVVNQFDKSSGNAGTKMTLPPPGSTSSSSPSGGGPRKGKGAVYRIDADGRVDQLHALGDGYFTALQAQSDGSVLAAAGTQGKVFLLKPDRTVFTIFDFPERQVLAIVWSAKNRLLATGDAGGLYAVDAGPPSDASYVSKVFDADFQSRFGNLRWHGTGSLVFETRSGNTAKPDKTWSGWQKLSRATQLGDGGEARVSSPEGRYLQFRVAMDRRGSLRDAQIYYLPQNQRPRVTEISVGDDGGRPRGDSALASLGAPVPSASGRSRSPVLRLRWKTENPDGDELIYRLFFREESEANWKSLGGTEREPLTKGEYDWNTEAVPDGNYVVRVVASDERANPRELATEHALTSQPFLIDNRRPEVVDLKVDYPTASGQARDSFSHIQDLAYSVDGGEWEVLRPKDGLLDDLTESFVIRLPAGLSPGTHTLAVRASDAADNLGASQVTFQVR